MLVAIAVILGAVALKYRAQKRLLAGMVTPTPAALAADLSASSQHWSYRNNRPIPSAASFVIENADGKAARFVIENADGKAARTNHSPGLHK